MKSAVPIGLLLVFVALIGVVLWLWTPDKSRAALEADYLARPGDMVTIADTSLHVRDTGPRDAPAVILLHGFGASLHTWEGWAKALVRQGRRVISFDLPSSMAEYAQRLSLTGRGGHSGRKTTIVTDASSRALISELAVLLQRTGNEVPRWLEWMAIESGVGVVPAA
jgi:hypothetical protein